MSSLTHLRHFLYRLPAMRSFSLLLALASNVLSCGSPRSAQQPATPPAAQSASAAASVPAPVASSTPVVATVFEIGPLADAACSWSSRDVDPDVSFTLRINGHPFADIAGDVTRLNVQMSSDAKRATVQVTTSKGQLNGEVDPTELRFGGKPGALIDCYPPSISGGKLTNKSQS